MNARCFDHSGVCTKIEEVKRDVIIEKQDREKSVAEIWKGIDTMRGWVIAGMATVICSMGTIIIQMLLK